MSPTAKDSSSTTTLTHPASDTQVEVTDEFKGIYLDQGWLEPDAKPATTK